MFSEARLVTQLIERNRLGCGGASKQLESKDSTLKEFKYKGFFFKYHAGLIGHLLTQVDCPMLGV